MKRSEALKLIQGLFEVGVDLDPETRAENLLSNLEESGMLPPQAFFPTEKTILASGYNAHKWESEDEAQ